MQKDDDVHDNNVGLVRYATNQKMRHSTQISLAEPYLWPTLLNVFIIERM